MQRLCLTIIVFLAALSFVKAEDWPAWRGPAGIGQTSDTGLPLTWSATDNIRWKVALPGPGNSTPIVVRGKVLVTVATDEGKQRRLMCFDRQLGTLLWEQLVAVAEPEPTHETNPYCSSSPVSDGTRVIVWHGSAGVWCYDLDGKLLWQKDLGNFEHIWGTAASPLLVDDLVILNCGPGLRAFVVALNKLTGQEVWRREFADMQSQKIDEFRGSWSTPVLDRTGDEATVLLSLPKRLHAIDPRSGADRWSSEGLGDLVYTSPLVHDEVVVAMSGYHGPAMAVRRDGQGDVTATHRLWWHTDRQQNLQRVGSGVIVGNFLYILNEPGIAWCIHLQDGSTQWKQRLSGAKSWSSMCLADGRIYVNDMDGTTFVIEPNPEECRVLAKNPLGEMMRSSLAFSAGQIFARTYQHLYCIAAPP